MKKILFSDKYGLTDAVLNGTKTQTRRLITCPKTFKGQVVSEFIVAHNARGDYYTYLADEDGREIEGSSLVPVWEVGEIVAVGQSYKKLFEEDSKRINAGKIIKNVPINNVCDCAGWKNKMYVKPTLMPHKILITKVWIERLQNISEDDCIAEGIIKKWHAPACRNYYYVPNEIIDNVDKVHLTPQEAYASLIDKLSGKGTWDENPFVFCYEFELIK